MTDNEYLAAVLRDQTLSSHSSELKALVERGAEIRALLASTYGTAVRIREAGSKAKGTMIRDSYDLDLTAYFDHDDTSAGENIKEIHADVEETLSANYHLVRKGTALRVWDDDQTVDFHVDVVPGRFVEGKDGDVFLYPSSSDKERLKTNLDVHVAHVRDSKVVDAIRLMKLWRERGNISIKTFALELLVIKLLADEIGNPLTDQLTLVWTEFRDSASSLAVEDPANPEGNDLSEMFNYSVRAEISEAARRTLETIEDSGWEEVFGTVDDDHDRAASLARIATSTLAVSRPWGHD